MTLTIFFYHDPATLRQEYSDLVNKLADDKKLLLHELIEEKFSIQLETGPFVYANVTEAYIFSEGENFHRGPNINRHLSIVARNPMFISQLRHYGVDFYIFVRDYGALHKRILMLADKIVDPNGNIYEGEELMEVLRF